MLAFFLALQVTAASPQTVPLAAPEVTGQLRRPFILHLLGSAAAFTVHDIALDAPPEPMPLVEIEQPET